MLTTIPFYTYMTREKIMEIAAFKDKYHSLSVFIFDHFDLNILS
jgi:hypothetical protein